MPFWDHSLHLRFVLLFFSENQILKMPVEQVPIPIKLFIEVPCDTQKVHLKVVKILKL